MTYSAAAHPSSETREERTHIHFATTPMVSSITGRTIYVNYHASKFAVLPGFSTDKLQRVRESRKVLREEERNERWLCPWKWCSKPLSSLPVLPLGSVSISSPALVRLAS